MIQEIGIMIGIFIFVRCFSLMVTNQSQYASRFAHILVIVSSGFCMMSTAFLCLLLLLGSRGEAILKP